MSIGRSIWFELYVSDVERAKGFYRELLGWQTEPFAEYDPENYFLLRTAEGASAGGALVRRGSVPGLEHTGTGNAVVYLQVAGIEAALASVERARGRIVAPRREIGPQDGVFALVADPDGNVIGLWAQA